MRIPQRYCCNSSVYRSLRGLSQPDYQLGCGFIFHKDASRNQILFNRYGGLLLLQGQGSYIDESGREIKLVPGDFVQRMPGVPHYTPVSPCGSPWLECFIVFGAPLFEVLADMGVISRKPVLRPGLDLTLVSRFFQLMQDLRQAEEKDLGHLLVRSQSILATVHALDDTSTTLRKKPGLLGQACRLLGENPEDRSPCRDLLAPLPLSYERLRKIFRQEIGVSPGSYRLARRMDRARELLLSTSISIKQIALQLGYPDPYTFSRQFTLHTGQNPTGFRSQH